MLFTRNDDYFGGQTLDQALPLLGAGPISAMTSAAASGRRSGRPSTGAAHHRRRRAQGQRLEQFPPRADGCRSDRPLLRDQVQRQQRHQHPHRNELRHRRRGAAISLGCRALAAPVAARQPTTRPASAIRPRPSAASASPAIRPPPNSDVLLMSAGSSPSSPARRVSSARAARASSRLATTPPAPSQSDVARLTKPPNDSAYGDEQHGRVEDEVDGAAGAPSSRSAASASRANHELAHELDREAGADADPDRGALVRLVVGQAAAGCRRT